MASVAAAESRTFGILPIFLVSCNVLGICISYAITIVLARHLPHASFEQYVGTVATLGMLASLGEAGFGKYALKVVPVYLANGSRNLLAGYLRFALIGSLLVSLSLGALTAAVEIPLRSGNAEKVVLIAIFFLPVMSGFGVAIDILLAFGRASSATLIARVAVPLTTLALMLSVIRLEEITPYTAIICFGMGSLAGLLTALVFCFFSLGPQTIGGSVQTLLPEWTLHGLWYVALAFLISWIFKAPLILLHHLPHKANELALLAPALECGCLVLLIAKSTDKYFQPTMSMIIESGDWEYGRELRKQRFRFVGAGVIFYLLFIMGFGKAILGLYGQDFIQAYPALCLIAFGSSCWTLFSLAPGFLLFVGEYKFLLLNLVVHGMALAILTCALFLHFGVLGAASAYMLTVCSLSLTNLARTQACVAKYRNSSP